jgi:hypothetical protein
MKFYKLFLIVILSSFGFLTQTVYGGAGGPPAPTFSDAKKTEDRAYVGLVWTLKEKPSYTPDLILGFRSLKVKSNDNASGGDLSIRMKLEGGVSFDSTRLVYVGGERDLLGNIGVGYSNANSTLLGTIAVQSSYARLGTDYELNKNKFVPYLELNTLDNPKNVPPTESVPPG